MAAVLLLVPMAGAVQKVRPAVEIGHAEKSGKNVKFTIAVTLALPASACKGKVTASHKVSKKKTLKWSASMKFNNVGCVAEIKGKLPVAKYGKKAKFGISFDGSKSVKAFNVSKTLTIVDPPAPPAPVPGSSTPPATSPPAAPGFHAKGHWATDTPTSGPDAQYSWFINASGTSPGLQEYGGSFKVLCGSSAPYDTFFTNLHFDDEFGYFQDTFRASAHYASGLEDVNYTFSGQFTSQYAGVGHFEAVGQFDQGDGTARGCHVSQDFALYYTGP
jgi:hypothetical protein